MPWWGWLLGGCGGCAVVVLAVLVIAGIAGFNFVKDAAKGVGPINRQSVQQGLGEVPLYPGFTINEPGTRGVIGGLRVAEKVTGKGAGSLFKAAAIGTTPDAPNKVLSFYEKKLPPLGWRTTGRKASSTGAEQVTFSKGSEVVFIQTQAQEGGTVVTIMRGGQGMPTSGTGQ